MGILYPSITYWQPQRDKVTSHWDPFLMYSSVMGSREQKPYATLIDRISLAVFEDSGWYKVNYSLADPFLWGKGQGCKFGHQDLCKAQDGFCSKNLSGCHHLRLSKARCNVDTADWSCGIFAADQIHSTLEVAPRCYETKCTENSYYVRLNGGNWTECSSGSYAQIRSCDGFILCPSYGEICSGISVKRGHQRNEGSEKEERSTSISTYVVSTSKDLFTGAPIPMAKNGGARAVPYLTRAFMIFYSLCTNMSAIFNSVYLEFS
ncbi:leishmanolysin peptidase-like protein [Elysia marginata]|uniref:Leishmanolysin-like peptidase n=1 Tax=Elysia marginata TaxID=1093978 RepID=A0AAV4I525_9GAST|nr:leishmanolysin peptidase-like protein [Elysia marginata]